MIARVAVSTRGLVKRYGRRRALDGFTLDVPEGCVMGLVGPNGAGKTTWMMAVAGLVRTDAGTVGLFLGLSHIVKSGGKATALGILALLGAVAWSLMLKNLAENVTGFGWAGHLDALVPDSAWTCLWRRSPAVVLQGVVHLAALAFLYLSLGAAGLRRRDI